MSIAFPAVQIARRSVLRGFAAARIALNRADGTHLGRSGLSRTSPAQLQHCCMAMSDPGQPKENIMKSVPYRLRTLAAALALAGAGFAHSADGTLSQDISDARHEAQIWTTYGFNPHLRALDLSVEVNGSTAVLSGTVENGVEKDLAEQIALGTDGISKVDNKITVDRSYVRKPKAMADGKRDFSTTVEDATITASVKSKLMWNDHTDGLEINVDTMHGKVTLSGTADTPATKDLATRLARNTDGVRGVVNNLSIDANHPMQEMQDDVSDAWITSKVKSTLLFSRSVDGLDINVSTSNGTVTLRGNADSGAEKDLAVELAKSIRGVKKVDASALRVS
jgi:osmotically-inducible protein OsmY